MQWIIFMRFDELLSFKRNHFFKIFCIFSVFILIENKRTTLNLKLQNFLWHQNWNILKQHTMNCGATTEAGNVMKKLSNCEKEFLSKAYWHHRSLKWNKIRIRKKKKNNPRWKITTKSITTLCGIKSYWTESSYRRSFNNKLSIVFWIFFEKKDIASVGNRTRINCLEGNYADHYTTNAHILGEIVMTEKAF